MRETGAMRLDVPRSVTSPDLQPGTCPQQSTRILKINEDKKSLNLRQIRSCQEINSRGLEDHRINTATRHGDDALKSFMKHDRQKTLRYRGLDNEGGSCGSERPLRVSLLALGQGIRVQSRSRSERTRDISNVGSHSKRETRCQRSTYQGRLTAVLQAFSQDARLRTTSMVSRDLPRMFTCGRHSWL